MATHRATSIEGAEFFSELRLPSGRISVSRQCSYADKKVIAPEFEILPMGCILPGATTHSISNARSRSRRDRSYANEFAPMFFNREGAKVAKKDLVPATEVTEFTEKTVLCHQPNEKRQSLSVMRVLIPLL